MADLAHNPLSLLLVQLVIIIGLSRLIGRGARWLGQPLVIAEVLAGILLGPSLLGWVAPEVMGTLFPASSMPVLKMLSQVGLILFMFLIGLELEPRVLRGQGRTSVLISHTSLLVPLLLGALVAWWLYPRLSEPSVPLPFFVLFVGLALSMTAFAVLARILSERGLLRSKVGLLALTCAAVDDVTAWCLLAFLVSLVRASGLEQGVYTTLFVLLYIGFMLGVLRPFLHRLGARVASREGLNQNVVALIVLLLLASSWVTERIGIHTLFGAFLFGAIIPKEGGLAEALVERLEDVVGVMLLPVFFVYSGLRTHLELLGSGSDWALCGLILLVASVGKFGGSAVAARLSGLRWREAGALGILMNVRGLMGLIVLNLGLDLGLISPKLFTMMVVMALVTALIASPLLRWVYPPGEQVQDRVPLAPVSPPVVPAPFTVLMCVGQGQVGRGMATLGHALIGSSAEPSQFYALHLVAPSDHSSFHPRREEDTSGDALAPLLGRASSLGLEVRPLSFVSAEPGLDICRTAEAKQASLILLGWHEPLFSRAMLGGTVHEVMREAGTDVAVLVDRGLEGVRRVLVPFLDGPHDRAALALARRLLRSTDAQVTVLHVTPSAGARGPTAARSRVEKLFPGAPGRVHTRVVAHGSPEDAALEEARRGYDLVVMGVGARHRERLIREAPTSLLVVHPHSQASAGEAADVADNEPDTAPALPADGPFP
ncbi:cation:proton antiporter [Archangium violaceum]|uniref:cation:proton antiporter domain-containing protein n=1 Tax=Archangium violaceum TaxID=83451 RepID=UPI00194F933B|nr:cation:proton antiporter [Archangium violaceum]QRO00896.1 cation:proton antiporter [Archangium violaceum]